MTYRNPSDWPKLFDAIDEIVCDADSQVRDDLTYYDLDDEQSANVISAYLADLGDDVSSALNDAAAYKEYVEDLSRLISNPKYAPTFRDNLICSVHYLNKEFLADIFEQFRDETLKQIGAYKYDNHYKIENFLMNRTEANYLNSLNR